MVTVKTLADEAVLAEAPLVDVTTVISLSSLLPRGSSLSDNNPSDTTESLNVFCPIWRHTSTATGLKRSPAA